MGWFTKVKNLFSKAKDKVVNETFEEYGEVEDLVNHPLYVINSYWEFVDEGRLIRGAWPSNKDLQFLRSQLGVTTSINLCSERTQDDAVKKVFIIPYNIGFRDNTAPSKEKVDYFLDIAKNMPGVTYVHCEQGKGRTGCMVAAYRVKVQGWTVEQALKEAEAHGLAVPCQQEFILGLKKD
jgi:protein tyrosine phosphatase